MHESGLTIPQVIALHVLEKRGPLTVSDVAAAIRLSRAATSHLVERLMRRAMVHREEDAEDRRQKQVSITDEGGGARHGRSHREASGQGLHAHR